jgi:DNA helicase IV
MQLPSYQELSEEQDEVYDLPLDGNWLVTGPPGTGKTVMALYRAKLLNDQGRQVLLQMYNVILRQYIQQAAGELGLTQNKIRNWHSWFKGYWIQNFGSPPPYLGRDVFDFDWDQIFETLGREGIPRESPDSMIIDEGQDLSKNFYLFADKLTDHLTVFADEDQGIHPKIGSTVEEIRAYAKIGGSYRLATNYRNTKQIAQFASHFYTGPREGLPELPRREGPEPAVRQVADWKESVDRIAARLANFSDESIGVFLHKKSWVEKFAEELQDRDGIDPDQVQVYWSKKEDPFQIDYDALGALVTFAKNAKGQEFDTVFVCEIQRWKFLTSEPSVYALWFVLSSRARTNLEFHYSGQGRPEILDDFPEGSL